MLIKNKKLAWPLVTVLLSLSLYACGSGDHTKDLHTYMEALKKAIIIKHKKNDYIAKIHFPVPIVFQSTGKERNPFIAEEASYTAGNMEHPLTAFPLTLFEYIGMVNQSGKTWAVIRAPNNIIYQLTINDHIGNSYGRIVAIYPDHLEVEEETPGQTMGAGAKSSAKNIVNLRLKGRS